MSMGAARGTVFRATFAKDGTTRTWRVLDRRVPRDGELYQRNNGSVTVAPANTVQTPRLIVEEAMSIGQTTQEKLEENVKKPFNPVIKPKSVRAEDILLRAYDGEES